MTFGWNVAYTAMTCVLSFLGLSAFGILWWKLRRRASKILQKNGFTDQQAEGLLQAHQLASADHITESQLNARNLATKGDLAEVKTSLIRVCGHLILYKKSKRMFSSSNHQPPNEVDGNENTLSFEKAI